MCLSGGEEVTEAQKKAVIKYRKGLKRFTVDFNEKEQHLYNHLSKQGNKQAYIKRLIQNDINITE